MEIMTHDQDKHNRFKIIAGGIIAVLVVAAGLLSASLSNRSLRVQQIRQKLHR